jgi:cysteinyl-tRNA synthetase
MSKLKIYSTLSGQKEDFLPEGSEVKMYVCGITPYADAHIGHAMSYINFDVVRRYLRYRGFKLKSVQNFTDVDDKIIKRARENHEEPLALSRRYSESFNRDMRFLNVLPFDIYPRVSEEIPEIIKMVQGLVEKGHAYAAVNGDVYFSVSSMPSYGKLSNRNIEDMQAGARVEIGEEKKDPADFALWEAAKEGEIAWASPWGKGRPGWHIECSAMALKYLGDEVTIHGGGHDLVFPHHENEIAQTECYTGKPFAHWWMHNGLLRMNNEKMSKSFGNIIVIQDILKQYSCDDLRVFVLSSHYRKPLSYSAEILDAAAKGAARLAAAVIVESNSKGCLPGIDTEEYRKRFLQAMDDDFNSPRAMAVLFDLARDINREQTDGKNVKNAQDVLKELGGEVLGLTFVMPKASFDESKLLQCFKNLSDNGVDIHGQDTQQKLDNLINKRVMAKKDKNFPLADLIRKYLTAAGIEITDTGSGSEWRVK